MGICKTMFKMCHNCQSIIDRTISNHNCSSSVALRKDGFNLKVEDVCNVPFKKSTLVDCNLIFINEKTFLFLELANLEPLKLNEKLPVCYAYCYDRIPLMKAGFYPEFLRKYKIQKGQVISISRFVPPIATANSITCSIRMPCDHKLKLSGLNQIIKLYLEGAFVEVTDIVDVTLNHTNLKIVIDKIDVQSIDLSSSISLIKIEDEQSLDESTSLSHEPIIVDLKSIPASHKYHVSNSPKVLITNDTIFNINFLEKEVTPNSPSLNDFAGYSQQVSILKNLITAITSSSFSSYLSVVGRISGILLFGCSGTGKTYLCRATLNTLNIPYTSLEICDLWRHADAPEIAIEAAFAKCKKSQEFSVLFIDDLDLLCGRKASGSMNEFERRSLGGLISIMNKANETAASVIFLATTNRIDTIDGSLRRAGRFDREIELGVPSVADRTAILRTILEKIPQMCVTSEELVSLAQDTHGFVSADLVSLIREATIISVTEQIGADSGAEPKSDASALALSVSHLRRALLHTQPSAMREVVVDIPNVRWSDIGGQEALKHQLRQCVEWPIKHLDRLILLGITPPKGVLLYGPPGCSKTMIAKALATETGLNFIAIKGPEMFSKWVGESEKAIRELFRRARLAAPAIVFIDEIDALGGKREGAGSGSPVAERILTQLLTELDGVEILKDIVLVAATNRPDMIDDALLRPGRFDRLIYVGLPDVATRSAIFGVATSKTPLADDVNPDELAALTDGYSGAEIAAVCNEAGMFALDETMDASSVTQRHFQLALEKVRPRTTAEMLRTYDRFHARGVTTAIN